jgi:hypothetical protein
VSIRDTLQQYGFRLVDSDEGKEVYASESADFTAYVQLAVGDGVIQAVKSPEDPELPTTVVHFNQVCDELTELLRKWSNVTPLGSN